MSSHKNQQPSSPDETSIIDKKRNRRLSIVSSYSLNSFLKIPPADPNFFSKTSMIQLGYGVWINMSTLVTTGLAIGFTTISLPVMQKEDSEIKITLSQEPWIATVLTLCIPLGSILGGILMDEYGRQPVIVLCGVPVSLGWLFIGFAKSINTFIIGSISVGVGLGMILTAPRAYITEITLPNMRGVIGALPYFFISVGVVTVIMLVVYIEWQTISYMCSIYSFITMLFNCYLPETPHFVLLTSPDKAIENLKRFRSESFDVENEMEMMRDFRDENDIRVLSFRDKIGKMFEPEVCKPFAISLAYILLMLCSGCVVVLMWKVEILEWSNAAIVPSTGSFIICITRIPLGLITSAILYKAKRRVMAIISAAGVGVSAIGMSVHLHTHVGRHITPFYFFIAYISFAVLGYYTLPFLMMFEILPLQLRGILSGINITLMNLIIFGMNVAYPIVHEAIGLANIMAVFGGISLLGTIILYYILPETSEVTLLEIEEYFGSKRPTLISSRTIRSDQLMSMIRASSSQVQKEKTKLKSLTKLNKKNPSGFKHQKGLAIENEGGSKVNISGKDRAIGNLKDEISYNDKDGTSLKISFINTDEASSNRSVSKNSISNKDEKHDSPKYYTKDQGSSKDKTSNRIKYIDDEKGYEDKTFDREEDQVSSKDKRKKEKDDEKENEDKKIYTDKDQSLSKDNTSNRKKDKDEKKNNEDETFDTEKDQGSSKDNTSDRKKDKDDEKENEDIFFYTDKDQGLSKDNTFNRKKDKDDKKNNEDETFDTEKDQGSSKDNTSKVRPF